MDSTAATQVDGPAPEAPLPSTSSGTPEEVAEQVERLLRDAHLWRMRDQSARAEALSRQALALSPNDPTGLEMLGDLLMGKGELAAADEHYRRALEQIPDKPSLEEKIARIALRKDEDERERIAAQLMLSTPRNKNVSKRSVTIAALLSLVCAGAGQLFNRQFVKGGILLGTWILCLALGWQDVFKFTLGIAGLLPRGERVNDLPALIGFVGLAIWVYSLLDAASMAGKVDRELDV